MLRSSLRLLLLPALATAAVADVPTHFDFGAGPAAPGCVQIAPDTLYTPARGYGLIPAGKPVADSVVPGGDSLKNDALVADGPLDFALALPEGNYCVTVLLGDPKAPADTSVKAEARRLMIESQKTKAGEIVSRTFIVNLRRPDIAGGGRVSLKKGEDTSFDWDNYLNLEFNGPHAAVAGLTVVPAPDIPTLYIAGDSTVTDQPNEPYSSWAQMLPRFFGPGIAVANHSWSGLTLRSFESQHRLAKILSTLRPGDYVFIQFGHNDQKEKGKGVGAFTTYAASLRHYIDLIEAKGGHPVLVTSMYRRRFKGDTLVDTLGDYPEAVRRVGKEKKVPVIDLHAMSGILVSALGPKKSERAYAYAAAGTYPGQTAATHDNSHFSDYGGYELARCIVEGIRKEVPALVPCLAPDAGTFDPAHPDAPDTHHFTVGPAHGAVLVPEGH